MIEKQDLEKARAFWYKHYNLKNIDNEIAPYLKDNFIAFKENQPGRLERARLGLFFSAKTIAEKLNITQPSYTKLEANEVNGSITLLMLLKAAEAMDCELVYAIRPKAKNLYSDRIWQRLARTASEHPSLRSYDPKHRARSIAAIANRLMNDAKFKKEHGWSQRANQKID